MVFKAHNHVTQVTADTDLQAIELAVRMAQVMVTVLRLYSLLAHRHQEAVGLCSYHGKNVCI
jgi:hypothetical protein